MKTHAISVVAALLCGVALQAETPAASPGPQGSVHGPVTHKNLQIFLVQGEDRLKDVKVKMLDEAMKEKSVVVRETSDVNKLSIQNNADAGYVYVQSGDIVKGGKQDRTLPNDFLVKAGSGPLPLEAFCVEQGRWQQRGGESVAAFSGSTKILSSYALKYAAKVEKSQGAVWEKVAGEQQKLSANVYKAGTGAVTLQQGNFANGANTVNDPRSATSLQLALENKDLAKLSKEYTEALRMAPESVPGAVGFAYAVNGVMTGAEIYANGAMFLKLWPKLLESVVTEAIAGQQDGKDGAPLAKEAAGAWMDETTAAASKREEYPAGNATLKREAKKSVRFDTLVPAAKGKAKDADWIHRSILSKEGGEAPPTKAAAPAPPSAPAPARKSR
jgi:hypothetical protein